MFDLSFGEILVIGFVIVLFVKPEEVPEIMRAFGKGLGKLRNLSNEFAKALEDATRDKSGKSLKQELREVVDLEGKIRQAYDVSELDELYEARAPELITELPKPKKAKPKARKPAAKKTPVKAKKPTSAKASPKREGNKYGG